MNLFGLMMELHNQKTEKTNWTAFSIRIICRPDSVDSHLHVLHRCNARVDRSHIHLLHPRVLDVLLPAIPSTCSSSTRRRASGRITFMENTGYIVLSIVAKTALAWQSLLER